MLVILYTLTGMSVVFVSVIGALSILLGLTWLITHLVPERILLSAGQTFRWLVDHVIPIFAIAFFLVCFYVLGEEIWQ